MTLATIIEAALAEDIGSGDITTDSIVPINQYGQGVLLAKSNCTLAGLDIFVSVFKCLDESLRVQSFYSDGDCVCSGTKVLQLSGNYQVLLKGERTALNFLQRLTGIASLTQQFVGEVSGTKTRILDTRKTTPLYRELEKYAVRMGGGVNHRMGLFDEILIKDNHITAVGGDVCEAIRLAKSVHPDKVLVVEVFSPSDIDLVMKLGVSRLLLDNMNDGDIAQCLQKVRGSVPIEVSGNVTLARVKRLAQLGVDYISIGALTHSAPASDISFKIKPVPLSKL